MDFQLYSFTSLRRIFPYLSQNPMLLKNQGLLKFPSLNGAFE